MMRPMSSPFRVPPASAAGLKASLVLGATLVAGLAGTRPAHATDPVVGLRSLAMGDTLRGYATGDEGTLLNPAGIGAARQFSSSGFYSLRVQSLGHFLHTSVADSLTQKYLAIGLYTTYFHETPHFTFRVPEGGTSTRVITVTGADITREGNESGLVLAVPLSDRFSFGATLKYAYYTLKSQLTGDKLPPDFSYANPNIDGDHTYDLGSIGHVVTFDVGVAVRVWNELRIGIVGSNLWAHGSELPTTLGLGAAYRFGQRATLAVDSVIDFTGSETCVAMPPADPCSETEKRTTFRIGAGGEYVVKGRVPLRLGYMFDDNLGAHHVSGGIGYINQDPGFGLDFSFRQRVAGGNETVLLLGFRVTR